jgi:DNA gyrase/topoisomerase IV subunit A
MNTREASLRINFPKVRSAARAGRRPGTAACLDRRAPGDAWRRARRAFPVDPNGHVMLATDAGQSIRVPVAGISLRSRSAGGVRVFNTGTGERVVSVALVAEAGDDEA